MALLSLTSNYSSYVRKSAISAFKSLLYRFLRAFDVGWHLSKVWQTIHNLALIDSTIRLEAYKFGKKMWSIRCVFIHNGNVKRYIPMNKPVITLLILLRGDLHTHFARTNINLKFRCRPLTPSWNVKRGNQIFHFHLRFVSHIYFR